jgi:hypothetical protein
LKKKASFNPAMGGTLNLNRSSMVEKEVEPKENKTKEDLVAAFAAKTMARKTIVDMKSNDSSSPTH